MPTLARRRPAPVAIGLAYLRGGQFPLDTGSRRLLGRTLRTRSPEPVPCLPGSRRAGLRSPASNPASTFS